MFTFTGESFENEVRNIARNLYSNSPGQGSELVDKRERDGVFWNGEFFTIIEATIERTKIKAEYDAKKTNDLVVKRRQEGYMARGLLVTLNEPTVDQKSAVKKFERTTQILSFDEFRSRLFDSNQYLITRSKKPFGSVFDHVKHTFEVPREEFVEPTLESKGDSSILKKEALVSRLVAGERFIITAEYGIGKSMMLREIFFDYLENFLKKSLFRVPLAINLRDHLGQEDPIELLERHARSNGVDPRKLVAAWSAGYTDLLIDGFDELSTRGWTGSAKKLREYRRSAHKVLRKLIKETPAKSAILVAGRDAYFDSETEMRETLGTPKEVFNHYVMRPFDDRQVKIFLSKKKITTEIPEWIPTRPLFLSYLATKGLLNLVINADFTGEYSRGTAWASLIEMIGERESEQLEGVDKNAIIAFLSAMATLSRQGGDVQKSFSPSEMEHIFYSITGSTVTDDERKLLIRLPGLGIASDSPINRTFIDDDFLNACSGISTVNHINNQYRDDALQLEIRHVNRQISDVGVDVICALLKAQNILPGVLRAVVEREVSNSSYQLAYDIFMASIRMNTPMISLNFIGLDINEINLCEHYYDEHRVSFDSCLIGNVVLPDQGLVNENILFKDCLIGNLDGRVSSKELKEQQFQNCEIDQFGDSYSVNSDILYTSLPQGIKVLVVTLRKIFIQAGSSRLESALVRGLDHRSRTLVPEVIDLLLSHKFIVPTGRQGKRTFAGTRSMRKEALAIIQSPNTSSSPIVVDCKRLS